MTRARAGEDGVPKALNALYYAQRASAGLIITESTQVCAQGASFPCNPSIYSSDQVAGWRIVTDAVHAAGGRIMLQLWHAGRAAHPSMLSDGSWPVGPSAIAADGPAITRSGWQPHVVPRAMEREDNRDVGDGRKGIHFGERRWERSRLVVENGVLIGDLEQEGSHDARIAAIMAESQRELAKPM